MIEFTETNPHNLRCETCKHWSKINICITQKGRCKKITDFNFSMDDIRSAGIPWQVWETIQVLGCASHDQNRQEAHGFSHGRNAVFVPTDQSILNIERTHSIHQCF